MLGWGHDPLVGHHKAYRGWTSLVSSYSPAVDTPRNSGILEFLWLSPLRQALQIVPGQMLAAQEVLCKPTLYML